jgi:single-stranded DNA-binding protein
LEGRNRLAQRDFVAVGESGNYLLKGKQVYVEGRISNRSYEQDGVKKFFTEIVADEVILLGGRGEGGGPADDFGQPAAMPRSAPAERRGCGSLRRRGTNLRLTRGSPTTTFRLKIAFTGLLIRSVE